MSTERQEVAFIVKIFDQFPKLSVLNEVLDIFILDIVTDTGAPSEVQESLMYEASSKKVVVSVKLCVSLFKKHHPEFVAVALGKQGLTIWIAGDKVIDGDCNPLSILAEANFINTCCIHFFGNE